MLVIGLLAMVTPVAAQVLKQRHCPVSDLFVSAIGQPLATGVVNTTRTNLSLLHRVEQRGQMVVAPP